MTEETGGSEYPRGQEFTDLEGVILGILVEGSEAYDARQIAKATGFSVDVVEATLAELERRELVEKQ